MLSKVVPWLMAVASKSWISKSQKSEYVHVSLATYKHTMLVEPNAPRCYPTMWK